jgi:hypothetical protein
MINLVLELLQNGQPSGVYKEYCKIINKDEINKSHLITRAKNEKKDDPDYGGSFKLIPILFSGDQNKSIPDEQT